MNIACGTDPARRDAILADFDKHFPEWNDKVADLVWELRPKSVLPRLEKLLADPKLTAAQKGRIVDILAVNDDPSAGKVLLARRHAESLGVSLAEASFYTDSLSDLPMLEAVGRPVAVHPDPRLRRVARQRGWEIADWDA